LARRPETQRAAVGCQGSGNKEAQSEEKSGAEKESSREEKENSREEKECR